MASYDIFSQWDYRIALDPKPAAAGAKQGPMYASPAEPDGCAIVYVHAGKCLYAESKEQGELEAGALLLSSGGFIDVTAADERCIVTVIRFDPPLLQPLLKPFSPVRVLQPFENLAVWQQPLAEAERSEMDLLLERLDRFHGSADPLSQGRQRAAAVDLLLFICGQCQEKLLERKKPPTEKEKVVREIITFIESRYMDDLSMEQLEAHIHLSKYYMMKLFKELTGMTIFHYLNHFRINQAKVLIYVNKELSITEVGYQVGFKQPSHFSRNFKEIVGLSPEQYRRMV